MTSGFSVLIGERRRFDPARLSTTSVSLRRNFNNGLDELANALSDRLGITAVRKQIKQKPGS
jgi:hypothetical protein